MNEVHIKAVLRAYTHDLRGSLSASSTFAQMLIDEYGPSLDERAVMWLSMMSAEYSVTQLKLISLTEYAQLFDYHPEFQLCEVEAIVAECSKQYKTSPDEARFSDIDVQYTSLPKLNICKKLLCLYFSELIANSAQHAKPEHEAALIAQVSSLGSDEYVELIYQDNGCALSQKDIQYIQQPLNILNNDSKRASAGLGISKLQRMAEMMGATMSFTAGCGSYSGLRVSLRIPK